MKIEVEKKIDQYFQNTRKYNDLVDEIEKIGEVSNTIEVFKFNMDVKWNNLIDKYFIRNEFYEYKYNAYIKKNIENAEEQYILVQIDSKPDNEKIEAKKKEITERQIEMNKKFQYKYNDDSYLNDMRVTYEMIRLYKLALSESKSILIKNPHYMLDHKDKMKIKFYEYLINILSDENMDGVKKKILLDNSYTKYMSYMTDIEIELPLEIRYL
jgi:hypothetical protein